MRCCHRCGIEKPLDAFYANSRDRAHGRAWECKVCTQARVKAKYESGDRDQEAQRGYGRTYRRKQRLADRGLTLDDYDRMWDAQNGRCAICGGEQQAGRALSVDHDHETGHVRALLCNNCNVLLGHAHEDVDRLIAAAAYLLSYRDVLTLRGT